VRHTDTYLVAIDVSDAPYVGDDDRVSVETLRPGLHQVFLRFGYLDELDIPAALSALTIADEPIDLTEATYFVGRETVRQGDLEGMHPALEHLYTVLHRGADTATRFFNLPPDRVFEVGTPVEL
jgi:KUP system potassium uptake protein